MVNDFFKHNIAGWIRYDDYEWKTGPDGYEYLMPVPGAKHQLYKVFEDVDALVIDAIETAMTVNVCREDDAELHRVIRKFVCKYGLLGIMTALPATTKFLDYEKVFLPKNILIREEVLDTQQYLDMFFPFARPDFTDEPESGKMGDQHKLIFELFPYPQTVLMEASNCYGERFDWLKAVFQDWMFVFLSVLVYNDKKDEMDPELVGDLQDGLSVFDGNAPTYHFRLHDGPVLVWDFHSLLLALQMAISIMLTDSKRPIKFCKGCGKLFVAKNANAKYCSKNCRGKRLDE